MPEAKRKLTLTVDAETVEAAKKLGLNISEVTERLLRGYTFDPDRAEKGASREQYNELVSVMDPLLRKYGAQVVVGTAQGSTYPGSDDLIFYSGEGRFYFETEQGDDNDTFVVQQDLPADNIDFLKPTQILKNFLTAIESAKNRRREEVESLVLAKRLVEALNEQEAKRATAGQSTGKKGGRRK